MPANPSAGTPSVEEAVAIQRLQLGELMDLHVAALSPIRVNGWREYDKAVDALIAAVRADERARTLAEVREIARLRPDILAALDALEALP